MGRRLLRLPQLLRRIAQQPVVYNQHISTSGIFSSETPEHNSNTMELSKVIKRLHKVASPSLAAAWDNVGLLVEPSAPHQVKTIFLTNDLTPPVLDEAIKIKSDLILSYHPPIFAPMKRLTQKKWKEEIIVKCIENRIAVFSPHTSYDCVQGGVNDWLISCFDCTEVKPVEVHLDYPSSFTKCLQLDINTASAGEIIPELASMSEVKIVEQTERAGVTSISMQCTDPSLVLVMGKLSSHMSVISNLRSHDLNKVPKHGYGGGRKGRLSSPISLDEAVAIVKKHLGLNHVRLAAAPGSPSVSSVAVGAGSGSSTLRNVSASLYVTGEMSHHDVLHAVYNGSSVILCEHSNTERGFLYELQKQLRAAMETNVDIVVSQVDTDPLVVV